MARLISYQLGAIEDVSVVRVCVGGRLKPAGIVARNGHMIVYVKGSKTLFEANEYTFYKVHAGHEIPEEAKLVGVVADEVAGFGLMVVGVYMANTTLEANRAGRDVRMQALEI